jgi:hypothetical protein
MVAQDFQYAVCVVTSGALQLTHRSDVQEVSLGALVRMLSAYPLYPDS